MNEKDYTEEYFKTLGDRIAKEKYDKILNPRINVSIYNYSGGVSIWNVNYNKCVHGIIENIRNFDNDYFGGEMILECGIIIDRIRLSQFGCVRNFVET